MAETLVSQTRLPAPPDAVFDAWTDAETIERWWRAPDQFKTKYTHDRRVGGAWRADFTTPKGESHSCFGAYRRLDRPTFFALTYQFSWAPDDPPILAAFEFTPEGADTLVTITQTGAITDDMREDEAGGWGVTIAFLRDYLAKQRD
jgi:uncharacterized protein YndB with AHSA1/START domain